MNQTIVTRNGQWEVAQAIVDQPTQLNAHASLVLLVKEAADALERHYPGWMWAIRPDEGGGIVDIMCLRISSRFGYTLHLGRIQNDPTFKAVINAGGEFLERFGFRRGRYSTTEWHRRELVMGQFIPDVSDMDVMTRRNMNTQRIKDAVESGHARISTDPNVGRALRAHA